MVGWSGARGRPERAGLEGGGKKEEEGRKGRGGGSVGAQEKGTRLGAVARVGVSGAVRGAVRKEADPQQQTHPQPHPLPAVTTVTGSLEARASFESPGETRKGRGLGGRGRAQAKPAGCLPALGTGRLTGWVWKRATWLIWGSRNPEGVVGRCNARACLSITEPVSCHGHQQAVFGTLPNPTHTRTYLPSPAHPLQKTQTRQTP